MYGKLMYGKHKFTIHYLNFGDTRESKIWKWSWWTNPQLIVRAILRVAKFKEVATLPERWLESDSRYKLIYFNFLHIYFVNLPYITFPPFLPYIHKCTISSFVFFFFFFCASGLLSIFGAHHGDQNVALRELYNSFDGTRMRIGVPMELSAKD